MNIQTILFILTNFVKYYKKLFKKRTLKTYVAKNEYFSRGFKPEELKNNPLKKYILKI